MSGKLIPYIAAAILILAGCAPEIRRPMEICPGKKSAAEALAALQSHSQNMVPMQAKGQCLLQYFDADKKKHKERLAVRVLVNPPLEIYLQGDKALIPKAIVLGSNEREFWLSLRPKEISTHWWGKWSEQDFSEGIVINPRTLLEALGIEQVDMEQDWSLSNEGAFDILTKQEQGVTIKKIYIYSCDYRVRRIEFFDRNGRTAACAELEKYKEVSEGFFVPASIEVATYAQDNAEDSLGITLDLKSIKPAEITKQRRNLLLSHRLPRGLKTIYRVIDGKWIEQPQ